MEVSATGGFLRFFFDMPDPRAVNKIHKLSDMIVIAVMAVICGADGWAEVEMFGHSKQKWLATFLELPGGIPSHDTFGRLFSRLDPEAFERCFLAWMSSLVELMNLQGAVVTIDAMGTQRGIAKTIVEGKGGYILPVKDNQPVLHQKVKALLDDAALGPVAGMKMGQFCQSGEDHGPVHPRPLGGGEQSPLATGRQLQRGSTPNSNRQRCRERLAIIPNRVKFAEAG
jgi:hypothetical protein